MKSRITNESISKNDSLILQFLRLFEKNNPENISEDESLRNVRKDNNGCIEQPYEYLIKRADCIFSKKNLSKQGVTDAIKRIKKYSIVCMIFIVLLFIFILNPSPIINNSKNEIGIGPHLNYLFWQFVCLLFAFILFCYSVYNSIYCWWYNKSIFDDCDVFSNFNLSNIVVKILNLFVIENLIFMVNFFKGHIPQRDTNSDNYNKELQNGKYLSIMLDYTERKSNYLLAIICLFFFYFVDVNDCIRYFLYCIQIKPRRIPIRYKNISF